MSRLLEGQPDPSAIISALSREVVHYILLCELRFASGTVYMSNQQGDFTDLKWGNTWRGLGGLVGIGDIDGGPDDLAPYREYLLGIPWQFLSDESSPTRATAQLPALIGKKSEYVGREANLWVQMFAPDAEDTHGRPIPLGYPIALDASLMSDVSWSFVADGALLRLKVEGLLARKGAPLFGMLTYKDQLRRHPGDEGLRFVAEVVSTNPTWTSW